MDKKSKDEQLKEIYLDNDIHAVLLEFSEHKKDADLSISEIKNAFKKAGYNKLSQSTPDKLVEDNDVDRCIGYLKAQLDEIKEWLIKEHKEFKRLKIQQKINNPSDYQGQAVIGGKIKAFQQVIDKINQYTKIHSPVKFSPYLAEIERLKGELLEAQSQLSAKHSMLVAAVGTKKVEVYEAVKAEREKGLMHYKVMVANILTKLNNDSINIVNVLDEMDKQALSESKVV